MKDTIEYRLIKAHYGDRVAKRSQVPLINHIEEGLVVLDAIGATDQAKRAFCIHPLVQADEDLVANYNMVAATVPNWTTILAMEYRSVANEFLSDKMDDDRLQEVLDAYGVEGLDDDFVRLSPLKDVNDMLIADKVQNYKDFVTYHQRTHERSSELDDYFNIWLNTLGVSDKQYGELCQLIDESKL
jgi:hypothetical protein